MVFVVQFASEFKIDLKLPGLLLIDNTATFQSSSVLRPEALWRGFNAPCTLMPCAMEGFIARVRV